MLSTVAAHKLPSAPVDKETSGRCNGCSGRYWPFSMRYNPALHAAIQRPFWSALSARTSRGCNAVWLVQLLPSYDDTPRAVPIHIVEPFVQSACTALLNASSACEVNTASKSSGPT